MKSKLQIDPSQMINASLLFFITTAVQIGVGIYGFQSTLYKEAKQDSWISVILIFLAAHIVVFVMFKTLKMHESDDIYGIHLEVYGKFLGNFMNLILVIYWGVVQFAIIKNYTEVINTWVFPFLSPSFITITLLILVIYTFTGGLRVMIGICFFSYILPLWILIVLVYPLEYTNVNYLLPVFTTDFISLLKGAYSMTFTIIGFEAFNVLYPYIKEKNKAEKYVHLGLLSTLSIYLFVLLISLTFFSGDQLEKVVWATLTLFSVVRFPFLERIELITICYWMLIILPNICLYAWSSYRGVIRMVNITEKKFIIIFAALVFIGSLFIRTRTQVDTMTTYFGHFAFCLIFIYPFFLYIIAKIKKIFSKQRAKKNTSN